MGVCIEPLPRSEVTFKIAADITAMFLDCFQNEKFTQLMFGRFATPVPPPPGQINDYKRLWFSLSLLTYERLLDSSVLNWVLKVDGELAGFVGWEIPEPLRTKPTVFVRLMSWARQKLSAFLINVLFMFDQQNPIKTPDAMARAFADFNNVSGLSGFQYSESELASMSRSQLAETPYPRGLHTWCWRFMVLPKFQRKGYGHMLFGHSLDLVPRYEPVFSNGKTASCGPAKLGLFATAVGSRLYGQFGFRVTCDRALEVNGESVHSSLMTLVDPPQENDTK